MTQDLPSLPAALLVHRHEQPEGRVARVAEADGTADGGWKDDTERPSGAMPSIVASLLAEPFKLDRSPAIGDRQSFDTEHDLLLADCEDAQATVSSGPNGKGARNMFTEADMNVPGRQPFEVGRTTVETRVL